MEQSADGELATDRNEHGEGKGIDDVLEPDPDSSTDDREFGRRGWILVGAIVVSFILIPGILVTFPYVGPRFGLGYQQAYLVLPLVPAVLLAVIAVWATAGQ